MASHWSVLGPTFSPGLCGVLPHCILVSSGSPHPTPPHPVPSLGEQSQGAGRRLALWVVTVPGLLGAKDPCGNQMAGGPGEEACPHPGPRSHECCGCRNLGESALAAPTLLQIEPGPKRRRPLFSAESQCMFTLPPGAALTARARNAGPAGPGVRGQGVCMCGPWCGRSRWL